MKRHAVATVVMVCGAATVMGAVVAMNGAAQAPPKTERGEISRFEVAPPPPKKQEPKPRATPRKREAAAPRPTVAPPNLAGSFSALALPGAAVETSDVDQAASTLLGDVKSAVMTEDAVDTLPRVLRRVATSYPPRARAQGVTGWVKFSLLIDASGRVEKVKVLEASPAGVFEEAATRAIEAWEFEPATYQGEPVKIWARQTVRFDLT